MSDHTDNVQSLPINHKAVTKDDMSLLAYGDSMSPDFIEFLIRSANDFDKYADLAPDPVMMHRQATQIRKLLDYFKHLETMESKKENP